MVPPSRSVTSAQPATCQHHEPTVLLRPDARGRERFQPRGPVATTPHGQLPILDIDRYDQDHAHERGEARIRRSVGVNTLAKGRVVECDPDGTELTPDEAKVVTGVVSR